MMIFRHSVQNLLIALIALLLMGLLAASLLVARQAWKDQARAAAIANYTEAYRTLDNSAKTVRAQIPKATTALILRRDAAAPIAEAEAAADSAITTAKTTLQALPLQAASAYIANLGRVMEQERQQRALLDAEAALPPARRNLEHTEPWRAAVHRTTDAIGRASTSLANAAATADPNVAVAIQVRRYAWTIRDHYGIQCSDLRPNINANRALDAGQASQWQGNLAIYRNAWTGLDELLQRPGVSAQLRQRIAAAQSATNAAQSRIDATVDRLDGGASHAQPHPAQPHSARPHPAMPGAEWTAMCDAPFDTILSIGQRAEDEAVAHAAHMRQLALRNLTLAGLGVLLVLVFGVTAVVLIETRVARPMRMLTETVSRLGARALADPVPPPAYPDEMGAIARALEDLRLSELEAERLQQAMNRFTADASHQMRTPLSILRSHIAVCAQMTPAGSPISASLADIEGAADRLQRLLLQLLKLAQAEGAETAWPTTVDLVTTVREVAASYLPQALAAGLDLHFDCDTPVLPFAVDPLLLSQMLGNLVDNAIAYNRRGGEVILRLAPLGTGVQIEVEDNGPGIPQAELGKIFGRFYRLARDSATPGSGLGLAIVQSLAEKLNARLKFETGAAGRGLRALIILQSC